jgi:hypothetical protein
MLHVTVTVDDAHAGAMHEVAARLRDAGFTVDRVLGAIGVITGSVASSQLASIAAVDGVASVERQTTFQLAPPDAEVQ